MFSVPQYTSSELQQYNYFVMQLPVFEEKIEEPAFIHVYEEKGVLYCASSTSEGDYYYTYVLNNPLRFVDPSGYRPVGIFEEEALMNNNGGGPSGSWDAFGWISNRTGISDIGPTFNDLYVWVTGPDGKKSLQKKENVRTIYSSDHNSSTTIESVGPLSYSYNGNSITNGISITYSNGSKNHIYYGFNNGGAFPTINGVSAPWSTDYFNQSVLLSMSIIDNFSQARKHYFQGDGTPVHIGPQTLKKVINSKKFQAKHKRIISGKTTSLNGDFSVNLTTKAIFVGRTNVNYSIECYGDICSVTYDVFINDGFWDVDFIDENTLGRWGIEPPDGPGPNLERFGGTPYYFAPIQLDFYFTNPGY